MIAASEIGVKVRTMRIRYTFMKNVLLFFVAWRVSRLKKTISRVYYAD